MEFNADCNCHDDFHWTPLHYLVHHGIIDEKVDVLQHVRLLLEYGADVNIQSNFGVMPLHIAIYTMGETTLNFAIVSVMYNYRSKIPIEY